MLRKCDNCEYLKKLRLLEWNTYKSKERKDEVQRRRHMKDLPLPRGLGTIRVKYLSREPTLGISMISS